MIARRSLSLVPLLLLLIATSANAETFGAVLTGSQETPAVTTNGFGNATVTLDPSHTSISVNLAVSRLTSAVTGAHIHTGAAGIAGGVVINFNPATNMSGGKLNTTFAIDKTLGDAIAANPSGYYVNVHTTQNPGGEIRGQLTSLADASLFAGDLRSSNEVPANNSTAFGSFLMTIDSSNLLTFEIDSPNIQNPTNAHIHTGAAGVAGGVLVGFTPGATFSGGRLKGTVQLDATTAANIKANPAGYYVNVHTSANPGGEIRGQLAPANEYDAAVAGKVTNAAGDNFVTDVRVFNPSYDAKTTALVEYFQAGLGNNVNSTAAASVDIPPRGTAVLNDIGATLGAAGSTGALRVTSASKLAVTSRIYNDLRSAGKGTIGQFAPSQGRATALRRGVLPQLANKPRDASNPSGFRTNVGFFNPNQSAVPVRVELRDDGGTLLGTNTLTLAGLSQQQNAISTYFPGVDLSDRAALTLSFDASAPIHAYASVVDNISSDQIFVPAQDDSGVAASQ